VHIFKSILIVIKRVSLFAICAISFFIEAQNDPKQLTEVCVACHSTDGNSTNPEWPNLAGQSQQYLYKQLTDIQQDIRNIPLMEGLLDSYSEQQLAIVAQFYSEQTPVITGSTDIQNDNFNLESTEMLKLGENIYRFGIADRQIASCASCHSPTGMGNALAKFPRVSGQHATYLSNQLHQFKNYERQNDGSSQVMRAISINLRDYEIEAVANYMSGLTQ